jgi:hypothetical protein
VVFVRTYHVSHTKHQCRSVSHILLLHRMGEAIARTIGPLSRQLYHHVLPLLHLNLCKEQVNKAISVDRTALIPGKYSMS